MKDLLPKYFSSQWSFAQCRVGEEQFCAAFGSDPTTIIGTHSRYDMDGCRRDSGDGTRRVCAVSF